MKIERTFNVASDQNLVDLIERARHRLVMVCPALSDAVADALEARLDQGFPGATIIVDSDPEVYRLGYGTETAFHSLREASDRNQLDLRVQEGVRIGVVISDDVTMVFAPVPLLAEAGSTLTEKPNAIVLSGSAVERLAAATGAGSAETMDQQEIGKAALTPEAAEALKEDLKTNPPQPFDLARRLRVFTSKVEYVEIQVQNCRLSGRQVRLPDELLDVADEELRSRISSRLRTTPAALGPFEIKIEKADGCSVDKVDDAWVNRQRKRIEDRYTYVVPRFGRVIFSHERDAFQSEIDRFERNLARYRQAAVAAFEGMKADYEERLVKEYLPKLLQNPPEKFARFNIAPTDDELKREIRHLLRPVIAEALSFDEPVVRTIYKAIAPQSIYDKVFRARLEETMLRGKVPKKIIDDLLHEGDAAPAAAGFRAV